MSGFSRDQKADMRQCTYCGKSIRRQLKQCPYCREAVAEARVTPSQRAGRPGEIRVGLLCMLMAAVMQYFAGGYSPMELPVQVISPVTAYLVPLLFLSGLGLTLYGFFLRVRA